MAGTDRADITFSSIRPRVGTAVRPGGGWYVNNAGWIVGTKATLMIDTFASQDRTAELLAAIEGDRRRLDAQDTDLLLVLTHAHGDHANGAGLAEEAGATVFASEPAGAELLAHGIQTFPGFLAPPPWGEVRPPARFSAVRELHPFDLGGLLVEAHVLTGPAHSEGDVVVSVPAEGIVFAGDLVWNQVTPLAISGSVTGWLDALDTLSALHMATIVPGHGEVGGPDMVDSTRRYLDWIVDVATRQLSGVMLTDDAMLAERAASEWQSWPCPERDGANVVRAVADLTGSEFSFAAALGAMQRQLNGPVELER